MLPNSPLTVRVPGKLMIAGEFAVLEPYQKLAVMAVDRFVYATLEDSTENRVSLETFQLQGLAWAYEGDTVRIKTTDSRVTFVENAMSVVYTYLRENNYTLSNFRLSVRSELDDASGRKYGLGSSAAVVTSVTSAMLAKFLPEKPPETLVFKLAAVSHVMTQGSGSGADVAASSYGGWLEYSSFQAEWLKKAYGDTDSITELVEQEWPYFSANPVKLPNSVYLCIGWTGSPASTSELIGKISMLKDSSPELYNKFITDSKRAVTNFLQGIKTGEPELLFKGVRQNRRTLATLGQHANAEIETPMLTTLCNLAEDFGGAGKPSGAGGGDCGIAFMPSEEQAKQLMRAWQKAGIKPLEMHPCMTGASVI
ncbi:phosphomevalonate kinase [Lentibacillus cibarius]|uniref:phosphomevalonate kinase n=1 Tax=Lentibacillus cibarius TaxID=2583219 RepID=UPI001F1BD0B1|nr:phosphomevalonate kinase [Lentibacillus cibarius]